MTTAAGSLMNPATAMPWYETRRVRDLVRFFSRHLGTSLFGLVRLTQVWLGSPIECSRCCFRIASLSAKLVVTASNHETSV